MLIVSEVTLFLSKLKLPTINPFDGMNLTLPASDGEVENSNLDDLSS